ncbi:MAG: hypothetical protein Q9185_006009 [Variospora sp. 1 TL-2023]
MSSTALTYTISPSTINRENATLRLTPQVRTPRAHTSLSNRCRGPVPNKSKSPTSLEFLIVTKNPEVESKSKANRRTVRSNAIKHALGEKKRRTNTTVRHPHNDTTSEHHVSSPEGECSGSQTSNASRDDSSSLSNPSLPMVRTSSPRTLWPLGTVAAETSLMELDVMSSHFRKVKNQYSVLCHLLDTPDCKEDLASIALQSPVIYHATLYVATAQQSACARSTSNAKGIRSSLFHEGIVLRFVQTAIRTSKLPSEEVIFAAALLAHLRRKSERSNASRGTDPFGANEIFVSSTRILLMSGTQGVAQMVRLRGGVHCMTMPVLFNLLEWYVYRLLVPLLKGAYHARLIGTHTLNLAADVEYGDALPPAVQYPASATLQSSRRDFTTKRWNVLHAPGETADPVQGRRPPLAEAH